MKADRRHELQQNELAIYLGRINRSIEPYSRIIAVVVGALIIGAIAWGLYNSKTSGDRSDATLQLIQALGSEDAEVLAKVGDDFPNTSAGAWSRLYQGNEYLAEGIRLLFTNRPNAEESLQQAITAFEQAIDASKNSLLRSRANFGIARAAESLGNIDEAIKAYEACIAANESEAMVKKAEDRIKRLNSPETTEFLTWFSEQDFTPADPSLPPSLPGGATLPDLPDLTLPEIGGASSDQAPTDGIEMPEQKSAQGDEEAESKDATDAQPAEEKTSEEKPAEEKSAAEENAEEKPAEEKSAAEESVDEKPEEEPEATESEPAESETPSGDADEPAADDASTQQE